MNLGIGFILSKIANTLRWELYGVARWVKLNVGDGAECSDTFNSDNSLGL